MWNILQFRLRQVSRLRNKGSEKMKKREKFHEYDDYREYLKHNLCLPKEGKN